MIGKKEIGLIMLSVLLVVSAVGIAQEFYSLSEIRDQAAGGWHKTYVDRYNRKVIVDVDVDVYGADAAPVLKLDFIDNENERVYCYQNPPYDTVINIKRFGEAQRIIYRSNGEEVEETMAYGQSYGNDLTLQEAYGYLKELLEQNRISPEDYILESPQSLEVICSVKENTGTVGASAFYSIRLWQKMHEMPILTHATHSYKKPGWPSISIYLDFQMRNKDEYYMNCWRMEEVETVVDDIPLCSFDTVIQSLEKEIEAGYIQYVKSLRFGYAIYNDPEFPKNTRSAYDAECYYAVPSWVVECIYATTPKKSYITSYEKEKNKDPNATLSALADYKVITINAQTGKILDPFDKSKGGRGNADYQGFISWENAH